MLNAQFSMLNDNYPFDCCSLRSHRSGQAIFNGNVPQNGCRLYKSCQLAVKFGSTFLFSMILAVVLNPSPALP